MSTLVTNVPLTKAAKIATRRKFRPAQVHRVKPDVKNTMLVSTIDLKEISIFEQVGRPTCRSTTGNQP